MNIVEVLKMGYSRLDYGDRWLVWGRAREQWIVRTHPYGRILISTSDEEEAVAVLIGEE